MGHALWCRCHILHGSLERLLHASSDHIDLLTDFDFNATAFFRFAHHDRSTRRLRRHLKLHAIGGFTLDRLTVHPDDRLPVTSFHYTVDQHAARGGRLRLLHDRGRYRLRTDLVTACVVEGSSLL